MMKYLILLMVVFTIGFATKDVSAREAAQDLNKKYARDISVDVAMNPRLSVPATSPDDLLNEEIRKPNEVIKGFEQEPSGQRE